MTNHWHFALVLTVVDQTVIHVRSHLSLYKRGGRRHGYQIRQQRSYLIEHWNQIRSTTVWNVYLQGLDVQPAVLLYVEQAVVGMIILLLIVVPVCSLVQSKHWMHPQAQELVIAVQRPVKALKPIEEIVLQKSEGSQAWKV